jgi:hypothetical protein
MAQYENDEFIQGLDPIEIPDPEAFIPIGPPDGGTYAIKVKHLIPAAQEKPDAWQDDIVYMEGDIVSFNDNIYISEEDDNLANIPSSSPSSWTTQPVQQASSVTAWQAGVYTQTKAVVKHLYNNRLLLFELQAPAPFNSTNIATEYAAGTWKAFSAETLTKKTPSTAGATITLDFSNFEQGLFIGSAAFTGAKAIAVSNASNAVVFNLHLQVTTSAVITLPASFMMNSNDDRWNQVTKELTLTGSGLYEFSGTFDGTNWKFKATPDGGYI